MGLSSDTKLSNSYMFLRSRKKIKNRTVLAAMTNKQSYDNGILSDNEINWLVARARGGFGVITESATTPCPQYQ